MDKILEHICISNIIPKQDNKEPTILWRFINCPNAIAKKKIERVLITPAKTVKIMENIPYIIEPIPNVLMKVEIASAISL